MALNKMGRFGLSNCKFCSQIMPQTPSKQLRHELKHLPWSFQPCLCVHCNVGFISHSLLEKHTQTARHEWKFNDSLHSPLFKECVEKLRKNYFKVHSTHLSAEARHRLTELVDQPFESTLTITKKTINTIILECFGNPVFDQN